MEISTRSTTASERRQGPAAGPALRRTTRGPGDRRSWTILGPLVAFWRTFSPFSPGVFAWTRHCLPGRAEVERRVAMTAGGGALVCSSLLRLSAVCLVLLVLPGCSWAASQVDRLADLLAHPVATFQQQWEVCEGASEVTDESGASLGAKFTVAKPGDCEGDRMMVFATVARPKVLEDALAVSTGQTVSVEGKASGMRIIASSITRFKVRKKDRG